MEEHSSQPDLVAPCGRSFKTSWPLGPMESLYRCVFGTVYRDVPLYKNAVDLALYLQLLERLKPNSVIEIGSKSGGSALWFADMISAAGRTPHVVSIDLDPQVSFSDRRIAFLQGDACDLATVLPQSLLLELPRPWLVSEDSAHTYQACRAVLDFFSRHLRVGEYIVIEDGLVDQFEGAQFRAFENGPNRAVAAFLGANDGRFVIDAGLCDFFGYNATFNPNGWLKRV